MNQHDIPQEVSAFLAGHIDSVVQLEVLLLLHASPDRAWLAEEIGRDLRITPAWVAAQLSDLCARGLLNCDAGSEARYRYAPKTPELDRAVAALAQIYLERRVTIINQIFSKPIDKLRTFSDAFKLRKEDSDDR